MLSNCLEPSEIEKSLLEKVFSEFFEIVGVKSVQNIDML
jgi:hypothetical protein